LTRVHSSDIVETTSIPYQPAGTKCDAPSRNQLGRPVLVEREGTVGSKIDIDGLSEPELIDLNNRIVERLRFLHQARAHSRMLEFSVGDRVSFHPEGSEPLLGVLTRYNKKTVTVITEQGQRWNVSPNLLRKVRDVGGSSVDHPNVVELRKK
jgi:ribosomal protein L21E